MTIQEYLKSLLTSQEVNLGDPEARTLEIHKDEVTKFLQQEFGSGPIIKYAGSYAKKTMIRESYDLDIVCYFPASDTRSLKEIHDEVADHLKKKYLVQEKASAVRITNLKEGGEPNGYHIDVVPGRFIADSSDVFLHVTEGERERIQTNLKTHINHIAESGCADVIKLTKLWGHRNNLQLKTFVLELFVIKSLSGSHDKTDLQKSFLKVLGSFRNDFTTIQLIDPANTGNIVSSLIHSSYKVFVANAAKEVLVKLGDDNDLAQWEAVFRDGEVNILPTTTPIKNPSGPWAM
ncbi:MAG: nucleotidyltransferase [bacterium]|nr:nucleotidyltransferase [bacterium]